MSYDIYLLDPVSKKVITIDTPHHMRGGTYKCGGDNRLHLNITYNYAKHYYRFIDSEFGIRKIYGMTGLNSVPILQEAADKLSDDISEDYWESTEGNAKRPLLQLITMAKMRPDGIWEGD